MLRKPNSNTKKPLSTKWLIRKPALRMPRIFLSLTTLIFGITLFVKLGISSWPLIAAEKPHQKSSEAGKPMKMEISLIKRLPLQISGKSETRWVTAASGIVQRDDFFYIVSDDSLNLSVLNGLTEEINSVPILKGQLPDDEHERKKKKPDFESLFYIEDIRLPSPGLIAFPSGSKSSRFTAVFIPLSKEGSIDTEKMTPFDLAPLFNPLLRQFEKLNIEGALIDQENLVLFHRGNSKDDINRMFVYPKAALVDLILGDNRGTEIAPRHVQDFDLGNINGVKLTFSDATLFEGKIYFLASAENTTNPIDDGKVEGTIMGELLPSGGIKIITTIVHEKAEGLHLHRNDQNILVSMVTDNDDSKRPSELLLFNLEIL